MKQMDSDANTHVSHHDSASSSDGASRPAAAPSAISSPEHAPTHSASSDRTTHSTRAARFMALQHDAKRLARRAGYEARRWAIQNTAVPHQLAPRFQRPLVIYIAAVLVEVFATALSSLLMKIFPDFALPATLNTLGILLVGLTLGGAPCLVAALVGVILVDYVVLPSHVIFDLGSPQEIVEFLLLIFVGIATTVLASRSDASKRHALVLATNLAVEQARLSAVIEAVPDSITIHDATGRFVRINQAARDVGQQLPVPDTLDSLSTHYTLTTADGTPLAVADYPVSRALRGEIVSSMEIQSRDNTGSDRDLLVSAAPLRDPSGRIDGAVTVSHNITGRRALERRTHDSLDALLAMAQSLVTSPPPLALTSTAADLASRPAPATDPVRAAAQHIAALTCDVLGCRRVGITAVEPETEHLRAIAVVGLSPEQEAQWWREQRDLEQKGQRLGDGANPDDLARFRGGEVFVIDMTQPPFDQMPNPYHVTTQLIAPMRVQDTVVGILSLDFGGPPHHFTSDEIALAGGVARLGAYVLERERLLRERAEAISEAFALHEANRRMDEFLSIAGHELRTPLTTAKINVQLARKRLNNLVASLPGGDSSAPSPKALADLGALIARIETATRRQERLVDDLLDASRIGANKLDLVMEPADLASITQSVVQEQRLAHPTRKISLQAPSEPLPIIADADRIGQVLTNFLTNALKYSGEDQPVAVHLRRTADCARLDVRDRGPGIPPDQIEQVWEMFHRVPGIEVLSGSGIGLGLGLHIAREIIDRHGGSVGVESQVGEGSTFWFTLPLVPTGAPDPSATGATGSTAAPTSTSTST